MRLCIVSEPGRDVNTANKVVATGVRAASLRLQFVLYALMLLNWGWQAVREGSPFCFVMTALFAIGLGLCGWTAVSGPRLALVLEGETLELRRGFRPLSLAKIDIVAVRANVADPPSWGGQVLIPTRDRTVRLPALDRKPSELILRLQEWAEVGETPSA